MTTQTCRYFKGEPLYPFGYGLSYTTFAYENLKINNQYKNGDTVNLSVDIKNTGALAGDEVAQVYISKVNISGKEPIRSLKAFKRLHLNVGETKTETFTLPSSSFAIVNDDGNRVVLPGKYEISVGGGQPGIQNKKQASSVIAKTIDIH